MKTWIYVSFCLYNSISLWLNISCLLTVRGGRHPEISTWQDYITCMELVAEIADKFRPVIQGTWRQGKITRNMKTFHAIFQLIHLLRTLVEWGPKPITSTRSNKNYCLRNACFHVFMHSCFHAFIQLIFKLIQSIKNTCWVRI